jgi:hypothetical protein
MLIAFDGIARPIELVGCDDLCALFETILRGWRFSEITALAPAPVIVVHREDRGYRLQSPWLDEPYHDPTEVGIVCAFIVDLVHAYVADNPELLCLHCGAAEFDGRLVVFPSWYRAGKSSLVARLAAAGLPVFADDVMPITCLADEGVALGIAPRLRRPLPRNMGPLFRRFVQRHRGPSNRRYLYLDLPSDTLAPHGRTAPIGAVVLLDRQSTGRAELVPASKSRGLQRVILQNFARTVAAIEILERLRGLVHRVPCLTLRYSDLDEGAALLQRAFCRWPALPEAATRGAFAPISFARLSPDAGPPQPPDSGAAGPSYVRNPALVLGDVDNELFLVDPRNDSIYHLSPVAAGLWQILSEPTAAREAVQLLQGAFPDADRREIERDVTILFSDLLAGGLIGPSSAAEDQGRATKSSSAESM